EKRSRARLAAQEAASKIPGVLQDIVRRGTTGDLQKRLRRDIFMIFTAYFDESGTHAGAELTGMAGFLGDRRQWQKFESGACSGSCSRETSYMICASKRCNQRQTSRREDQRLPQVYDLFPQGELVGIVRRLVVERQVMHARVPVTRKFIDLKDRHLALALCRASNAAPACFRPHRRSNPSRSRSPRQPRRS